MDKKLSISNLESSNLDPYELITILNKKIKSQTQSLEWYKKMLETSEYEKKITLNELKKKKQAIQNLRVQFQMEKQQRKDYQFELQQLRTKCSKMQRVSIINPQSMQVNPSIYKSVSLSGQIQNKPVFTYRSPPTIKSSTKFPSNFPYERPLTSQLSLDLKQSEFYSNFNLTPQISRVLEERPLNNHHQFVPNDIRLVEKNHKNSFSNSSGSFLNTSGDLNQTMVQEPISDKPGQFLCEDLIIVGPDVSELKKKRNDNREASELTVHPAMLYTTNTKNHNQHTYTQIAQRCFPFNCQTTRKLISSYSDLKQIIQFHPSSHLSKDSLIFNLKGQPSQPAKSNPCFKKSNINQIQFIVCLKIPDFILLTKDQKHYQRPQQQVWMVEKFIILVTYYPFFDIHLNILSKIYGLIMKQKLKRILIDKEKFFKFDITRNVMDLDRNDQVKSIVEHFKQYRPSFYDVLHFKNHYYGTIPSQVQVQYAIANITAPIFFTNFCFQEMLLLLIGLLCQKTIVLMSKNQSTAALCGLFLVNILSPFPYSSFLLLNGDQEKLAPIVFQYPFPMIATIKKTTQNLHKIISMYASARIEKKDIKQESQRMILVDIDTNSIFYQGHTSFQQLIQMGHPGEEFMRQYSKVNSCYSKSFSFPKKLDARRQNEQFNKRKQEHTKLIEDMQQTIKSNMTKQPSFETNEDIEKTLKMLKEFVRSFVIDGLGLVDALQELPKDNYHGILRRELLQKHPQRVQLVEKILNSQYYADYLNMLGEMM